MKIYGIIGVGALVLVGLFSARDARAATPELVRAFDPTLGQLPESMATDSAGNFYLSMGSQVMKVDTSLSLTTLATLPVAANVFATGVKFAPDGSLFVASGGFDPALDGSFVFSVNPSTGAVNVVTSMDPDGFPNDLAFDDDGSTFVTDSFLGAIWKVTSDGVATIWLQDPLLEGNPDGSALGTPFGADGIAFDRSKRNLYVTNLDFGAILKIRVRHDGQPGDVEVFAADSRLVGADGIAFDRAGTLYVAVNAQDSIATVDRRGRVRVIAEGGVLDGPSSFAFGVAPCDRHTLFITSFAIARASSGGDPHPGIVSLRVRAPGLALP
jgi:sugar lactone lactonase YvrE